MSLQSWVLRKEVLEAAKWTFILNRQVKQYVSKQRKNLLHLSFKVSVAVFPLDSNEECM